MDMGTGMVMDMVMDMDMGTAIMRRIKERNDLFGQD